MAKRVRVGVVGCGLIAQVMHLPYLAELSDRFELAALCDVSPQVVNGCAERFAFYGPDRRLTLQLPSPFLRNAPSRLIEEGGEPGTSHSWQREEIVSYDEAFKRELVEFSDCIATGREPRTSGRDGLGDIRLCEAIAAASLAAVRRRPIAGAVS